MLGTRTFEGKGRKEKWKIFQGLVRKEETGNTAEGHTALLFSWDDCSRLGNGEGCQRQRGLKSHHTLARKEEGAQLFAGFGTVGLSSSSLLSACCLRKMLLPSKAPASGFRRVVPPSPCTTAARPPIPTPAASPRGYTVTPPHFHLVLPPHASNPSRQVFPFADFHGLQVFLDAQD